MSDPKQKLPIKALELSGYSNHKSPEEALEQINILADYLRNKDIFGCLYSDDSKNNKVSALVITYEDDQVINKLDIAKDYFIIDQNQYVLKFALEKHWIRKQNYSNFQFVFFY